MVDDENLLVLRGTDVRKILASKHGAVINAVRGAYCAHRAGRSFLPHSVFVRFPGRDKERIIALPGYLGGNDEIAGIKWIASFPTNLDRGMSRASAIMVLNSLETGRPEVVLEGSTISAARTAASAALAADTLHAPGDIDTLGVIGCGLINREIVAFIASLQRKIGALHLYDIDPDRAATFRERVAPVVPGVAAHVASSVAEVLGKSAVVSFATTAIAPTVADISMCRPTATLLHISLRDLMPDVVLHCDNVVDDVDHVMRAQTSVHLAEQRTGNRDFIRCTLADVIEGREPPRRDDKTAVAFSPFGLGVLDLAVAKLVVDGARENGSGTPVSGFFTGT